jgi:hypothetical protein
MSKAARKLNRKNAFSGRPAQGARKPRVLFAVGDADAGYSEGRIWQLVERLHQQPGFDVVALTHDAALADTAKKHHLNHQLVLIQPTGVTVRDRLQATDGMIRETANMNIPGSQLPLWKVLAMDDFLSSLQLFGARPTTTLDADVLIVPLMAVDNNTKGTCGLYTWAVAEARRQGIPVIGLEVSPLGNKNTLSHLPADYFAVKSRWSRDFLIQQGIARSDQVALLRWEESYLLWPGKDEFTDAYLALEPKAREMLGLTPDRFMILIPHHVAFLWEVRKILDALSRLEFPFTVVIRVDGHTVRRHYHEREIVKESYVHELAKLPGAIIDERVGIGLLVQMADLVIAPFAGTATERAALCRTPTIICQSMAQEGWRGEFTHWQPKPERIVPLIQEWRGQGWLERIFLTRLVQSMLRQQTGAALPAQLSGLPAIDCGFQEAL